MKNYLQSGESVEFTAPTGGVTSGIPVLIGARLVVPAFDAVAGARFVGNTEGVFTIAKTTGETWSEGQGAFWDAANAKISTDPSVGLPVGAITVAALSDDTTGIVHLNESSLAGRLLTVRKRFTIAQVNAGITLLPAIAGIKYRMVDAMAIAVGGAAAAVTTVDILATLSAASRKLVAFAQASLTQSAVLRAGGTGAAVLADGASFTANDAGTAVTVGITGSAITTATHIDFSFTYSLE